MKKFRGGLVTSIIVVLMGLGAGAFGVYSLTNNEVMCGGDVMRPGQICEETIRRRGTTVLDYEGQRDKQTRLGWIAIGAGLICAAYGGWSARNAVKERAAKKAVPAG